MTLPRTNQLALLGHLVGLFAVYLVWSRFVAVVYTTDSIVSTFLGVTKTLEFQNPYLYSIKPILDQIGFPPSYYTPRMDGSFEFHLTYPALNFLSLIPFYLMGLHDLRDGVLIFHLASVLILFGLAPSKFKALSIVPFSLAGPVLAMSWTDSIWAFFLLLSAVTWTRHRKSSLVLVGLAGAAKQIALVIVPFLLIRMWYENRRTGDKQNILKATGLVLAGFVVPNIPFLLASPGAWWEATMAPYLPGSPSLVPGGMGLSNILIDLGIALPSAFYLYATLSAGLILVYVYIVRFDRLNKYMWAFPMLMFFFYHRSFPNYIVYWSFPLIFEMTRWKTFRLKFNTKIAWPMISLPPVLGRILGGFRRRFTPTIMAIMIITAVLAGVSGVYVSRQTGHSVQVNVNQVIDTDNLGAATLLNVTLKNTGTSPVSPVFFIKAGFLPDIWTYNSSDILLGHSEQSYLIRATDALAAVPKGTSFRIIVSDRLTQELIAESSVTMSNVPAPAVINPHFKWWTMDAATGKKTPFGWKLTTKNIDLAGVGIEPVGSSDRGGLMATLNYTSSDSMPARLAMSQNLLFNATNINVSLKNSLANGIGNPVFGVVVADGSHTIYYLFSDTAKIETIINGLDNTTVTMPVGRSTWSNVTLRPATVWSAQGWKIPDKVTFTIFIQATAKGVYAASIGQVDSVRPATLQAN
ncbi:MAG TPA: hypothetical protein VFE98_08315 [Candidatus Bathyarchaeia archaeon]|nr:hypothetical protein [Candidatus Bathyarchaeia archaeon]